MVWPVDAVATSAVALTADGESGFPAEVYFLVFCARDAARLATVESQLSLVTDRELSVYSEWSRTYRENAALHAEIKALKIDLEARAIELPVTPVAAAETAVPSVLPDPTLVRWAKKLSGSL